MKVIKNQRLRALLRYLLPFCLMPAVIAVGMICLPTKYHAIVTVSVLLLSLVLFLCGFDRRMVGVSFSSVRCPRSSPIFSTGRDLGRRFR